MVKKFGKILIALILSVNCLYIPPVFAEEVSPDDGTSEETNLYNIDGNDTDGDDTNEEKLIDVSPEESLDQSPDTIGKVTQITEEKTEITEEPEKSEEVDEIPEEDDPEMTYEFKDEGTGISVYATRNALPEGTNLEDISVLVEEVEDVSDVEGYFNKDANIKLYSIDFVNGENVFEPEDIINVSIPLTEEFKIPFVYYVTDDGLVDMHATVEDENIVFTSTHFSQYVISDSEKITDNKPTFENNLPVVTIDDLTWYVQAGGSAIGFIGSDDDQQYKKLLSYYSDIYENADSETQMAFQRVDASSIYEGCENGLIDAAYDSADQANISNAIRDVLNGTTGNSAVIYTFNKTVVKVSTIPDELPKGLTLEAAAHIDFSSSYQAGDIPRKTRMMKSARRTSTVEFPEGYEWNLTALAQIQPFTAEVSGTYKIELWGADGDSDTNWPATEAAGIGGRGGYTTAEIHLNKGETVYFGLGFRNSFSDKRSWNGGGAGWGMWAGFSAGGGGAASMYSEDINGSATSPSTTELSGYTNDRDKVLLVAGGGGGAENYFQQGRYPYPCEDGHCVIAYGGGGGGTSGGRGSATFAENVGAPGTQTSGYAFGQGQDYPTSSMDASTGAGGGGWYGGYSVSNIRYESGKALQGGSGGGGSGYINTTYVDSSGHTMQNASTVTGGHVNFNFDEGVDDGKNARAKITLKQSDSYNLTVQYLQKGTETELHTQNTWALKKGAAINIPVYYISGYTVSGDYAFSPETLTETTSGNTVTFPTSDYFDLDDLLSEAGRDDDEAITGTMPAADIVLKIYYDYPVLRIKYIDFETKDSPNPTQVAPTYEANIQSGLNYSEISPTIPGYLVDIGLYETNGTTTNLTVNETGTISGTKSDRNEFYTVYYVPLVKPVKNIIEKNGMTVSAATSKKGVQLMSNDEYTYSIDWENKQHAERTITIVDTLPDTIEVIDGTISGGGIYDSTAGTITWTVNAPERTSDPGQTGSTGTVTFRAKVKSTVTDGTIDNAISSNDCDSGITVTACEVRKDPVVHYSIVKSADPVSGSDVAFDQIITYYIDVHNDGNTPINNLAVVDYIPENTGDLSDGQGRYPSANHDYHGEYDSAGNYVSYLIDELPVGAVARLSFQVAVTARQETTDRLEISNFGYHGVLPINNPTDEQRLIVVNPDGDDSTDDGKKTNTVSHYAIGPKVDVVKSSNPVSGTKVNDGDQIAYTVDLTNTGTVNTNWIRLVDKIPVGTRYVPNSLSLISDNTASNDKYSWMSGNGVDVYYSTTTGEYRLQNVATKNDVYRITVTWPNGITIKNGTYGSATVSGNTLTYTSSSVIDAATQTSFLTGIRWTGDYTATGSIDIKFEKFNTQTINTTRTTAGTQTVSLPDTNGQAQTYTIKAKGGQGGGGSAATEQTSTVTVTNGGTATLTVGAGGTAPSTTSSEEESTIWIGDRREGEQGSQATYTSSRFSGKVTRLLGYNSASAWWGAGGTMTSSVALYNGDGSRLYYGTFTGGDRYDVYPNVNVTNAYIQVKTQYGRNPNPHGYVAYTYIVTTPVAGGTGGNSSVTTPGGNVTSNGTAGTTSGTSAGAVGSASISGTARWYSNVATSSSNIPTKGASKGCAYIPAGTNVGGTTVTEAYVECLTSDLQPGNTAQMTFAVTVENGATDTYDEIDNTALYETQFVVNDSYAGTNPVLPTQETNMTVHPLGNVILTATKDCVPESGSRVRRGDTITYNVTLNNTGAKTARYVHVRDYIPEETTYAGGVTDNGVYVAGSPEGGNYVEWVVSVPANSTKTVSFNVQVNEDAKANYAIINEALYELKAENPGVVGTIKNDPANVTNEVYHVIYDRLPTFEHVVDVAKYGEVSNPIDDPTTGHTWEETASTDRSYDGHDSLITYTLRVANSGDSEASFVRVRDYIPEGTTFVPNSFGMHKSPMADRFSPDVAEVHAYSETGNYVEWVVYNVGQEDYVDVTYQVKIGKYTVIAAEGDRPENVIHNTALYQEEHADPGTPGEISGDPVNETNEVRTPLVEPHVSITEVAVPATTNESTGATEVKRRQIITYKLNVTNDSNIFLNYAVVESNIPQYTGYVDNSVFTVDQEDVKLYDSSSKTARYIVKDLAPGDTKQVSFQVQVSDVTPYNSNIVSYSLVKGYILDPVTPNDLPEPSGTRDPNGGEGYSNQQVHLLTFDAPPTLPDPYKRVSGGTTVVAGFENKIDYTNLTYTYDVYQVVPAEDTKAYFSMFMMRDGLPTNVLFKSLKVYANGTDVTDQFEYGTSRYDEDPDNISDTLMVSAKPEYLATDAAYDKTYDFRITVEASSTVQKQTEFINSAIFQIHYNDSEIEQNAPYGNTDVTDDGDPATRTTNTVKTTIEPKIPFKKVWADEDGYYDERPSSITIHLVGSDGSVINKTLTASDNWEWVFTNVPGYTAQNQKITYTMYEDEIDTYDTSSPQSSPLTVKFNEENVITNSLILDYPIVKNVYNTQSQDIDGEFVIDGNTLHYVISVTNPASVTKKFDVEDTIPANSTYVANSANLNAVYDSTNKKLTWTDVSIAANATAQFTFDVTAVGSNTTWNTIQNQGTAFMKRTNGSRNPNTEKNTNIVYNYTMPIQPSAGRYKTVTDSAGTDINTKYVEKDRRLYYHIYVSNGSPVEKEFTITDVVPTNTTFVSAGQSGTYDATTNTITWTKTLDAGDEDVELSFIVTVNSDNCDISNVANITVDGSTLPTNTVTNQAAKIVINKTIDNYLAEYGKPSFLYKVTGSDGTTATRMIELNGASGATGSTTFAVPMYTASDTTFSIEELRNARYEFKNLTTTTAGTTNLSQGIPSSAASYNILYDVNEDGYIDTIADVDCLQDMISGTIPVDLSHDINSDGQINASDNIALQDYYSAHASDSIITGGAKVSFSNGSRLADVSYINEIKDWRKVSHADSVTNSVD